MVRRSHTLTLWLTAVPKKDIKHICYIHFKNDNYTQQGCHDITSSSNFNNGTYVIRNYTVNLEEGDEMHFRLKNFHRGSDITRYCDLTLNNSFFSDCVMSTDDSMLLTTAGSNQSGSVASSSVSGTTTRSSVSTATSAVTTRSTKVPSRFTSFIVAFSVLVSVVLLTLFLWLIAVYATRNQRQSRPSPKGYYRHSEVNFTRY